MRRIAKVTKEQKWEKQNKKETDRKNCITFTTQTEGIQIPGNMSLIEVQSQSVSL